jgi:hypothetical protein
LGATLLERVKAAQPLFVVADALRTFWPEAETKNQIAAETIGSLRKLKGITWLMLHHRRKLNQLGSTPDLIENPHAWFQEVAGAYALVNQSDTRIGVVPHPRHGDLLLAGFIRSTGPLTPLDLARTTNEEGTPIGYRRLTGIELLNAQDKALYDRLGPRFRFKDVREAMGGTSDSNVGRFLKRCSSLGLAKKDEMEYAKVGSSMERVE